MSSSDPKQGSKAVLRRLVLARLGTGLLLGAPLSGLVTGCFRPMLAEGGPSMTLVGRVGLPEFDDRFGYYLNESLRDRLGRPQAEDFRLEVNTLLESDDLAITQDNAVTRISLTAVAKWALYPRDAAGPVIEGRTVSQSGYNSTASLFATRAAKLDIERRLARDLGERIARSLLARADVATATQAGAGGS
jgi:hypothetical protein